MESKYAFLKFPPMGPISAVWSHKNKSLPSSALMKKISQLLQSPVCFILIASIFSPHDQSLPTKMNRWSTPYKCDPLNWTYYSWSNWCWYSRTLVFTSWSFIFIHVAWNCTLFPLAIWPCFCWIYRKRKIHTLPHEPWMAKHWSLPPFHIEW